MQTLMFSSEELPVSHSQSQDSEKDWLIRVATSCSPTLQLLTDIGPSGWFGRTSPASFPLTEDETLPPSFEGWQNSGTGSLTEFLTLSTLEWPKDAAVCLLSDVLEDGRVPQRFFLSATACKGILRRAEKRGKSLPRQLQEALEVAAQSDKTLENQHINGGGGLFVPGIKPTKPQGDAKVNDEPIAFGWQNSSQQGASASSSHTPTLDKSKVPAITTGIQVRRLTPVECERLQGFPDGYTDIKPKGKPTPDGPRYKALGNSMAVPVMRWIGERIKQVEEIS
jgi:hypothetical protein